MKIRNFLMVFVVSLFLILSINFISALDVCCEETTTGAWCVSVPEEQCASQNRAATSCTETTYCTFGTCLNSLKGECTESTRAPCEAEGLVWDERDKDEIPLCQNGCCIMGDKVAFATQTECKQVASDYGLNSVFDPSLSESECRSLSLSEEEGACVTEENYVISCENYITKETCDQKSNSTFYPDLLCTAEGISNCAPTENTICYDEGTSIKVFFKDSCGNRANIYDETKFSSNDNSWNINMRDYWTNIQLPSCTTIGADSSCGDCNYVIGSTCVEYDSGKANMPDSGPKYGDYVCSSMECYYDTNHDGTLEAYQHGESWCAETKGTYHHLPLYLTYDDASTDLTDTEEAQIARVREELKDVNKYNTPGSRYVRLGCWDGEIKVYPCTDFRQEVCVEQDIVPDYSFSTCVLNTWQNCINMSTKTDCEETTNLCKWVIGYRPSFWENENPKAFGSAEYNIEEQGTCVPLIPTGIDFWNVEGSGQNYCALSGSLLESPIYETHWLDDRKNRGGLEENNKKRAKRCYGNCWAIPDYGKEYPDKGELFVDDVTGDKIEDLIDFHFGEKKINTDKKHISDREGYYCKNKKGALWSLTGDEKVNCKKLNDGKKEKKKRAKIPIFYTNEQWHRQIRERALAAGDCGYKENFVEQTGDPMSEIWTSQFQILDQKGEVKEEKDAILLWRGDGWIEENLEDYMSDLHGIIREGEEPNMSEYTYTDEDGDIWYGTDTEQP